MNAMETECVELHAVIKGCANDEMQGLQKRLDLYWNMGGLQCNFVVFYIKFVDDNYWDTCG